MKSEPSPRAKSVAPPPEPSGPVDRCYNTLPIKAVVRSFDEVRFAEQIRAPYNGDYAIVPKDKCSGDGTGA